MADPTLVTDHVDDALAKLLIQFRGQPHLQQILSAYLVQDQEIEQTLIDLMLLRYLATAAGAQLDGIGRIVIEPRAGKADDDYRAAIAGAIKRNNAHSQPEDLIELFVLLLPAYAIQYINGHRASFELRIVGAYDPLAAPLIGTLSDQLHTAKGGGVTGGILWSEFDDANTFTLADSDVLQADTSRGMADDTPSTLGGYLSEGIRV